MKILCLDNIPSPYGVAFYNELGKLCDLTVLFERRTADDRHPSWFKNLEFNFRMYFLKGLNIGHETAFCPKVVNFLKKDMYDFIIIKYYSTPTSILSINYLKLKKIPFVINADGGFIKLKEGLLKKKIKSYYISSADYWLSTGNETNKYLQYYGADLDKTFIYPFASFMEKDLIKEPITIEEKKKKKNSLNIQEEKVILSVGNFIYRKGFDVLIESCRYISDQYGVYVIGGEPTEEYVSLVKRYGLKNMHFVGFKSKDELKEYYQASDIFVFPTREDIWGLVVNEAMSSGLPVITTNRCLSGLELIKDSENGFIIPINDPLSLAKGIKIILENEELLKHMQENNIDKIAKYTIERMASQTIRILRNVRVKKNAKY